jgi:hypothetical protein
VKGHGQDGHGTSENVLLGNRKFTAGHGQIVPPFGTTLRDFLFSKHPTRLLTIHEPFKFMEMHSWFFSGAKDNQLCFLLHRFRGSIITLGFPLIGFHFGVPGT